MRDFFKKKDVQIILAVLVVALIWYLAVDLNRKGGHSDINGQVAIYLKNSSEPYKVVPLGKEETVVIDQGDGTVNELVVNERGAYMKSSTCDNQDCVLQGEVSLDNYESRALYSWIVCLPNQVAVELLPVADTAGDAP